MTTHNHTYTPLTELTRVEIVFHILIWVVCTFAILMLFVRTDANQLFKWDTGITCSQVHENGRLIAINQNARLEQPNFEIYESMNGGYSWHLVAQINGSPSGSPYYIYDTYCQNSTKKSLVDPTDSTLYWRVNENGRMIEKTTTGGKLWTIHYRMPGGREVRERLINKNIGRTIPHNNPRTITMEPQSGNLIMAMGHEGVLVVDQNGHGTYVSLGGHHFIDIRQSSIWDRLSQQILITLPLLSFGIIFMGWRLWPSNIYGASTRLISTLLFGIWFISLATYSVWTRDSLLQSWLPVWIYQITVILLAIACGRNLAKHRSTYFLQISFASFYMAALFFAPHFFWGLGLVQELATAFIIGTILALITWLVGQIYIYPQL